MAFARFWKRLPSFNAATDELSAQKHLGKGTNAAHKLPYFTFSHGQYGVPRFSWGLSSFVPSLPFFPSLLLSHPLSNDLCCYNYWVISTVITLNICSVRMLKAFGWAVRQLFYVLTVLRCRQIPPQSPLPLRHRLLSLCAICIGEMKWLLYEWEPYAGLICSCWCVSERKVEDLIGEVGWVVSRFCWIWRSEVLVMLNQKSKKEKQREDLQQSNPRYQTKKATWFFFHLKLMKTLMTV